MAQSGGYPKVDKQFFGPSLFHSSQVGSGVRPRSCNDIFREDGIGMRMPTCGLSFSPAACTSPPILGTRPAGPSGGMHLPDKALPEVHMVPPVPQHWGYQQAVPKQKSQRQSKQVPAHAPVAGPRTAKVAGKNKMAKVKEVTEVMEVKEERSGSSLA